MTTTQDQLIEAAHDLFRSEYSKYARPRMDEAEHDDCIRASLEAVIALVQDAEGNRYRTALTRARKDVAAIHNAGFDSERRELAIESAQAITAVLKDNLPHCSLHYEHDDGCGFCLAEMNRARTS